MHGKGVRGMHMTLMVKRFRGWNRCGRCCIQACFGHARLNGQMHMDIKPAGKHGQLKSDERKDRHHAHKS